MALKIGDVHDGLVHASLWLTFEPKSSKSTCVHRFFEIINGELLLIGRHQRDQLILGEKLLLWATVASMVLKQDVYL